MKANMGEIGDGKKMERNREMGRRLDTLAYYVYFNKLPFMFYESFMPWWSEPFERIYSTFCDTSLSGPFRRSKMCPYETATMHRETITIRNSWRQGHYRTRCYTAYVDSCGIAQKEQFVPKILSISSWGYITYWWECHRVAAVSYTLWPGP